VPSEEDSDEVLKKYVPSALLAPPAKQLRCRRAPFPPHSVDFARFEDYLRHVEPFRKQLQDHIDNSEVCLTLLGADNDVEVADPIFQEYSEDVHLLKTLRWFSRADFEAFYWPLAHRPAVHRRERHRVIDSGWKLPAASSRTMEFALFVPTWVTLSLSR
jgi:hypothetical protein